MNAGERLWAKLVEHRCDSWFTQPTQINPGIYKITTQPGYAFDGAFWSAFNEVDLQTGFVEYEGPARRLNDIENRIPLGRWALDGVFTLIFSSASTEVRWSKMRDLS